MSANYSLLCYTRDATGREEANNEDIAFSMHLALRSGDLTAEWTPLNENYGIFFAAGVPIAAATAESRRACTAAARFAADPFDAVAPPPTPSPTARRCPAWTSARNRSRIRSCSAWRTDDSPSRRPAPPAAASRTVRTVGIPARDQRRSDVVRSARTGAAWHRRSGSPSRRSFRRCGHVGTSSLDR